MSCPGGKDGRLKVQGSGPGGVLGYKWSTGATTREITNLSAGFYHVTVTCFYGPATATYQVAQPSAIIPYYIVNDVGCYAEKTGSINVTHVLGGTSPYTYKWSTGATTKSISNLSAGTYTLTITDSKSCTKTVSIDVDQPTDLVVKTNYVDNPACYQGKDGRISVAGSGGVSPYTYKWNTGATSSLVSNLSANTYRVTITDKNGCTEQKSYVLTEPSQINVKNVQITDVDCHGNKSGAISLEGSGGTPGYSFQWNTGATGSKVSGLSAGTYSVDVTDKNKCSRNFSFTVTQPDVLEVEELELSHNDCYGDSDGVLEVSGIGGVGPYSFSWSHGPTKPRVTDLKAGNYEVSITDKNGCTVIQNFDINQPDELLASLTKSEDVLCHGSNEGVLEIEATGGVGPYQYQWDHGPKSARIDELKAGNYSVIVTDKNGCTFEESYTVNEPDELDYSIVSVQDNDCFGSKDGSIEISAFGGTAPHTILWNHGPKTWAINELQAGTYKAIITDQNGCDKTVEIEVKEPEELIIESPVVRHNGCGEYDEGEIAVVGVGGTPPYSYKWQHGPTSKKVTGLTKGEYTVEVTDNNGCLRMQTFSIKKQEDLQLDSSYQKDNSCFGDEEGILEVFIGNGTGKIDYSWSTGDTTSKLSDLEAGVYTLYTEDENGCHRNDTFEIITPSAISIAQEIVEDVRCHGESNGLIELEAEGGTGSLTFEWTHGPTGPVLKSLYKGKYEVKISDENDCSIVEEYAVTQPDELIIQLDSIKNSSGASDGSVEVTILGGTPGFDYAWTGPMGFTSSEEDIYQLDAGWYTLTVEDAHDCTIEDDQIEVKQTTSTKGLNEGNFGKVFPNPTFGEVRFEADNNVDQMILRNAMGAVLKTWSKGSTTTWHMSDVTSQSGVYYLIVHRGEESQVLPVQYIHR